MKLVTSAALFQQVLKTGVTKCRFLGLDVGSKYVGLAVSDEQNKIAIPLSVLERTKKNINLMAQDFQTLVTKLKLAGFVVGYPFKIQGQSTSDAVQVKLFIEDLCKTRMLDGVSYTYWDENYTSRCVEAILEPPMDISPVDAKTILDKFAAVGILQVGRDAFCGTAPINLTDRLHQMLRWATGSVEIFFSRNNALFASPHMKFLQRVSYFNGAMYLLLYCILPVVSLLSGKFIVQSLNVTFLVFLLIITITMWLFALLEIKWSGITLP